jgi:exopolysaccharide biosynthesis protein
MAFMLTGEAMKKKKKVATSVVFESHPPNNKVSMTSTVSKSSVLNKNNKSDAIGNSNKGPTVPFNGNSTKAHKKVETASGKPVNAYLGTGPQKSMPPSKSGGVSANWKQLLKVCVQECIVVCHAKC